MPKPAQSLFLFTSKKKLPFPFIQGLPFIALSFLLLTGCSHSAAHKDNRTFQTSEVASNPDPLEALNRSVWSFNMAADKVLVSEWLEGTPLSKIIADGTQAERNNAGMRLARFHFTCPERAGLLHADPHPGNFRLLADGRIGVLDFGACNRLPNGFPEPFKNLLKNALDDDAQKLYEGFKKDGFILPEVNVDPNLVLEFLVPLVEPLRTETFKYSREWLRDQSARVGDPRNPTAKIGFQLNLPAEYVLIHRVTMGTTGIFCQLEAEGRWLDEAIIWLPEITPASLTR